ncbi:MAG: peptidase C25 [Melioribacteraceae bacterium]|nr:MAG: peptidase C25 [Melioribacteraceae bacterium]
MSSDDSHVVVEYSPQFDIYDVDNSAAGVKNIILKNGFSYNTNPTSQFRIFQFGTPSLENNTFTLLISEKKELDGELKSPSYDEIEEYSNPEILLLGNSGKMKDINVAAARVFPIKYDQENQKITLYTRIVFRINLPNSSGSYEKVENSSWYSGLLVNEKNAVKWGVPHQKIFKTNTQNDLASGTWYKFETPDEGIYRINRDELSSIGIDADNVDPRNIKIYSSGGLKLSETPGDFLSFDEKEIPIMIQGEEDGSFDSGDYILFYGRNVDFWSVDKDSEDIVRNRHPFTNKNYHFITVGNSAGERMEMASSINVNNPVEQTQTDAFAFFEENSRNLYKTGRLFVGDEFSTITQSHTYVTSLPNIIENEPVKYNYSFANNSIYSRLLYIDENGERVLSRNMIGKYSTFDYGRVNSGSFSVNASYPDDRSVLKFTFNTNSASINGYLDYFEIGYRASLSSVEDELIFYSDPSAGDIRYTLSGFTNTDIHIFEVTDYRSVKKITGASLSGGQARFIRSESAETRNKYIAACAEKFKSIVNPVAVNNNSITGRTGDSRYIIVTSGEFEDQALRLADFRENISPYPISSEVVLIEDIFNLYNFGVVDPTALRNFIYEAYIYRNVSPDYILLFGDASYDFFDTEGYGSNFVPSMHTEQSMNEVYAYPTDDYYVRVNGNDLYIDIAHGRIPVNSAEDAEIFVDKIINYETGLDKGIWRTKITMIADDQLTSDSSTEYFHTSQSEELADTRIPSYYDLQKIYLAAYPTVNTGSGRRKPSVNQAIIDAVNNGTLLLNFIGHGNPDTWTHEYVFERATTLPLLNNNKYFFLTAATCDFGRYDDPAKTSASEEMLFMRDKGMIGAFSATRAVFASQNSQLNKEFYNYLLSEDIDEYPRRVGYAYWKAKNAGSIGVDENSEKFHIFTDPALILNEPKLPGNISEINNQPLTSNVQLKALQSATIKGNVFTENSTVLNSGFNGEAIITVFDSDKEIELKELNFQSMELPGGVIFRGRVSVNNGLFNASFTVPKDITYENKQGKVVVYFFNDEVDGIGYTDKIIIGGTDTTVTNDGKGPEIEIYFDELDQSGAYLVNEDFTLLVRLEDETGLNTTGTGVGHKLEGVIDGNAENSFDLTNYFIGDLDASGKSGVIEYNISSMDAGDHSITVNAWDVFNNFNSDESYFTVVSSGGLVLRDVVNYPNPFSAQTHFTFQHNYSSAVDVKVKVYTIAGRLIKEIEKYAIPDKFVRVFWDGRDADGDLIANGTYLYKLIVETTDGQVTENFLGKMSVIR